MAKVEIPAHAEVDIDFTGCDDRVAIRDFAIKLMHHLRASQAKDWPGFDIKCKVSGPVVTVMFTGEAPYEYYPGSGPSYSSGGEPDDVEGLFDLVDVEDYVKDALKEKPDISVPGWDYASDEFLKANVKGNEAKSSIPTWDDVYAAYCDTFYPDEYVEGVIKSVLDGKSLTEALTEIEDWDIQPEELYSPTEIAQQEWEQERDKKLDDFEKWREFAYRTIDELSVAYKTFCEDVLDNPLGVDFEDLIRGQYGNLYAPKTVNRQFQTWLSRYKDFLIKYDPLKEE